MFLLILIGTLKYMIAKRFFLLLVYSLLFSTMTIGQNNKIPKDFSISEKSMDLFNLINDQRTANNLNKIELSASLSFVAVTHIEDLLINHPDTSLCNLHSWSDKGEWTACCYQPYIPNQDCMWDKPKELTPYKYRGYELTFYQDEELTTAEILAGWMEIPDASDMILNKGRWVNEWRAMGVGIEKGYAVVWFGRAADSEPTPSLLRQASSKAETITSVIDKATGLYYLVFGSYNRLKDAEKRLLRLQKDGFENAEILMSEGKYRLSLSSHQTIELAKTAKSQLAKKYDEAWILKY